MYSFIVSLAWRNWFLDTLHLGLTKQTTSSPTTSPIALKHSDKCRTDKISLTSNYVISPVYTYHQRDKPHLREKQQLMVWNVSIYSAFGVAFVLLVLLMCKFQNNECSEEENYLLAICHCYVVKIVGRKVFEVLIKFAAFYFQR